MPVPKRLSPTGSQDPDSRSKIPRIPNSRFQIPDSRSEFKIPEFQGFQIGIPNRVAIASSRYHLR
ncbi:MAG: hypothetical protein IPK58_02240 [Acidobacteria bacterium]|nr:hypothetical protein [Acidobacteriota bacterium]